MRTIVILFILMLLSGPCLGMSEERAVTIVVNDLRLKLIMSERWALWDETFRSYWTIYDVRGEFF